MSLNNNDADELLREYQQLPEFQGFLLTSVNQRGGFKSTPLHIAAYRERPNEVRLLLAAGADPNAAGEYGETPLQVAITCRNKEIMGQLLNAGARCSTKDEKGRDAYDTADLAGFKGELEAIVAGMERRDPEGS